MTNLPEIFTPSGALGAPGRSEDDLGYPPPAAVEGPPPLFRHQARAVEQALARMLDGGGFAFLMEMGTGKTRCAVEAAQRLRAARGLRRVLVFAPKTVCGVWVNQWKQYGAEGDHTFTPKGTVADRRLQIEAYLSRQPVGVQVLVVNYDVAPLLLDVLQRFVEGAPTLLVCDESTRVKNPKAKRTKAVHALAEKARWRLVLTGTPFDQSPLDAWGQYHVVDRRVLGPSYWAFRATFAVLGGYKGKQVVGYRNLPKFLSLVSPHSFRVTKAECLDLPEKVYERIDVDLDDEERAVYDRMRREAEVEFEDGATLNAANALSKLTRLQQIVGGYVPIGDEARPVKKEGLPSKMEAAVEIIEDAVEQGHKVVVWARFLEEIERLRAALEDQLFGPLRMNHERSVAVLTGQTRDRDAEIELFNKYAPVFIGQVQAGGLGIDLTAADIVVYYSNTFSLADRRQSEDRCHRQGQTRHVTYYDLVARRTVDDAILKALTKKQNLADLLLRVGFKQVALGILDGDEGR